MIFLPGEGSDGAIIGPFYFWVTFWKLCKKPSMNPRLAEWLGLCYHWLMLELHFPLSASSSILPLITSDLAQDVNKLS